MQGVVGTSVRAAKVATRERVVDCARRLFVRDGYEATSIRSVGREAGLSDAAIHYYFGSKQELLAAVIDSQAALAGDCRRHPDVCVTRDCLLECVLHYFFTYVRLPDLVRMLLREQIVNEPVSVESGLRIADRFQDALGPAFEHVYGEGGSVLIKATEMLLAGILWNEILDRGDDFTPVLGSVAFRQRVCGLVGLVLQPVSVPAGEPQ